jgi:hypothetical protein
VALGKKSPSFGLYRFDMALRFVPPDDEGFILRGDKRRLLYKGRRRSHRFTVLGDTAFEYDCILQKPPDENVITLYMEGAENFDFFRQPDFLSNPMLAGSFAVYKKETLIGEGTGKLCHIHRPEIIDAIGRRCWGDLSVVDKKLRITIPEWWLSKAVYPVVVDPTIGTTTVGSQYLWDNDPPEPWIPLLYEGSIPVNRFLVSETINGLCTAFFYSNEDEYGEAGCRPVLYSDNGDKPQARKSTEEQFIDLTINGGKPKGWRFGTFKSDGSIANGSYIWFGAFADFFWSTRFDYGLKCYSDDWWNKGSGIPNAYPLYNANWYQNFKLSMYFTYSSAQNYLRTITHGVTLNDSRNLSANYKRNLSQMVVVYSLLERYKILIQKIQDTVKNNDAIRYLGIFLRSLSDYAENESVIRGGQAYSAIISDTVHAAGNAFRGLILFVRIVTGVFTRDYLLGRFLKAREELSLKSAISRDISLESRID